MCVQVWKRAIAEGEERLAEMNRVVSEKISHQQRLIDKMQQYVRVQDNLTQREAPSSAGDNNSSNTEVLDGDNEETRQQDELSVQLSILLNSLKALAADNVQVCMNLRCRRMISLCYHKRSRNEIISSSSSSSLFAHN